MFNIGHYLFGFDKLRPSGKARKSPENGLCVHPLYVTWVVTLGFRPAVALRKCATRLFSRYSQRRLALLNMNRYSVFSYLRRYLLQLSGPGINNAGRAFFPSAFQCYCAVIIARMNPAAACFWLLLLVHHSDYYSTVALEGAGNQCYHCLKS